MTRYFFRLFMAVALFCTLPSFAQTPTEASYLATSFCGIPNLDEQSPLQKIKDYCKYFGLKFAAPYGGDGTCVDASNEVVCHVARSDSCMKLSLANDYYRSTQRMTDYLDAWKKSKDPNSFGWCLYSTHPFNRDLIQSEAGREYVTHFFQDRGDNMGHLAPASKYYAFLETHEPFQKVSQSIPPFFEKMEFWQMLNQVPLESPSKKVLEVREKFLTPYFRDKPFLFYPIHSTVQDTAELRVMLYYEEVIHGETWGRSFLASRSTLPKEPEIKRLLTQGNFNLNASEKSFFYESNLLFNQGSYVGKKSRGTSRPSIENCRRCHMTMTKIKVGINLERVDDPGLDYPRLPPRDSILYRDLMTAYAMSRPEADTLGHLKNFKNQGYRFFFPESLTGTIRQNGTIKQETIVLYRKSHMGPALASPDAPESAACFQEYDGMGNCFNCHNGRNNGAIHKINMVNAIKYMKYFARIADHIESDSEAPQFPELVQELWMPYGSVKFSREPVNNEGSFITEATKYKQLIECLQTGFEKDYYEWLNNLARRAASR